MAHYSAWGGDKSSMYQLTEDDLKRMHAILLEMYKDIKKSCDKYGIRLIAAGGTALGAIRHHGFIPWDDDMDICMFRNDYKLFSKIFDKELSDKYYLLAPGRMQGANCFLPRVMKKGTTLLGMIDETSPYPHGIYIDINPIEYAPANSVRFRIKGLCADILRFISYSVYWNKYKSKSLKAFLSNSNGAGYYKVRMLTGKLFSFRKAERWFEAYDQFVQGKKTDIVVIPSGAKKYAGERMQMHNVLPLKSVSFEDTEINVVNDYKGFLKNLYGDYMKIPTPEKRENHLCLKLDFDKE